MDIDIELEIGWFDVRSKEARMHEKGSHKLPIRKHLTKIANLSEFQEYVNTDYMRSEFNKSIENGMNAFGIAFINYYKNYVLSSKITPKLSPKTIALKRNKGSKTPEIPLVDTGLMLNSIEYRINK
ncbi:hypothetical protein [Borrelia hispanica]|uniref:hypothetical protein n=1 Tax=Borrelia hispanica TaxID=40835 RepID=UPI000465405A|nr:hypothetical protein [Borrelia hispanica]